MEGFVAGECPGESRYRLPGRRGRAPALLAALATVAILLSGCQPGTLTWPDFDRPSDPPIRSQRRAKIGESYTIGGVTHQPLTSGVVYVEKGIASWYSDLFHGQPTSSGELYRKDGFTAAHNTLPLGTMVQVTNLENHRQVVVRINDRGPFVLNRLIDLSRAAAVELQLTKDGSAIVSVAALDYQEEAREAELTAFRYDAIPELSSVSRPGQYRALPEGESLQADVAKPKLFVQVGASFSDLATAERLLKRLRQAGQTRETRTTPPPLSKNQKSKPARENKVRQAKKAQIDLTRLENELELVRTKAHIQTVLVGKRHLYRVRVGTLSNVGESDHIIGLLNRIGFGRGTIRVE